MARVSGKQQLLEYFLAHIDDWISNQTLRSVSGKDDVPRLVRMLIQDGWQIERRWDGHSRLVSPNKGEAKGRRTAVSKKIRYLVLQKYHFRCRACGRGYDEGVKLVIDHILPVDWGGSTDEANLQALCEDCNQGKQAWVADQPAEIMGSILSRATVEARIEALFDALANQDIPSTMIEMISKNAQDWQRALRAVRLRTKKDIRSVAGQTAYRYVKEG